MEVLAISATCGALLKALRAQKTSNTPRSVTTRKRGSARKTQTRSLIAALTVLLSSGPAKGQVGIGDSPPAALPLAHLSGALKPRAIAKAMRKVGDWELARSQPYFDQKWTFGVLYTGFMAASGSLFDSRYKDAMLKMGNKFDWKLGPRVAHADDQVVGQTYLALYMDYRDHTMLAPTRQQFDELMKTPDDPAKPVWWWCDALFMGPPVWARLYKATGNLSYLDYMDREWWITSKLLYDPQEHLYSRDSSYLDKHEANGQKLFWSRGDGWVMAGIVRVLEEMPENYPSRPRYIKQFQEMSARVASLQGTDGLWRSGLLDPGAYFQPENSGSALFVYALAWGMHHGILDRATYLPVVQKGWKGLVSHIYTDGRLGSIQPPGAAPGDFKPQSSWVYGIGGFLLAGSEVLYLAEHRSLAGRTQ